MARPFLRFYRAAVVIYCSALLPLTVCAQKSTRNPDSKFMHACAAAVGGNSNDATLSALVEAAEQIVGSIASEDRCAIYERALQKLTGLEISASDLSDVRLLSTLTNLESLTLRNNHITDLSPLASLTNLVFLDFTSNSVRDLSPLAAMTQLTFLRASGNKIGDLAALEKLAHLSSVHLENNSIHDVKPLALVNADLLSLSHNQITSIGALSQMPKIIRIYANSNKIGSVSDFTPPKTLMIVNLSDNPIGDDEIDSLGHRMGIPMASALRGDGIYDMQSGKRVVFTRDDGYNKDIDFVPTARVIKVKMQ